MYTNFESQDIWTPLFGSSDAWGTESAPDAGRLVNAFRSTVFSLVDLIAAKMGELSDHIKLGVAGQTKAPHRPLIKSAVPRKWQRKSNTFQEITEHLVLDLIDNPNPYCTTHELFALTQAYVDVTGNAYWYLPRGQFGPNDNRYPEAAYLIPSQMIKAVKNTDGWIVRYQVRSAHKTIEYDAADVVHFRSLSLADPYVNAQCKSPVSAIWLELQTMFKEVSNWDSLVTNAAEPRVLISPRDDAAVINQADAERLEKQYQQRYGYGGRGGPLVSHAAFKVDPLTFPPKDTSALLLFDTIHKIACRAFRVPVNYMDMLESSRASAESAEYALQKNCLKPRLMNIVDTLNKHLCKRYDSRLFMTVDSWIIKDRQLELQQETADLANGTRVVNEVRAARGLPPVAWGNKPLVMQAAQQPLAGPQFNSAPRGRRKAGRKKSPLELLVEQLQVIFREQAEQVLAGIGKSVKAVPPGPWFNLDAEDMAERLAPILQVFYDDASTALVQRLGFSPAVPKVVNERIPEAVRAAALAFCEQTNQTTTQRIEDAIADLRDQLTEGLNQGESANALTARVRDIFTEAETDRAYRIAVTEQSRAQHAAELLTIKEAGVDDAKKIWLAKGNACPECLKLNGKSIGLDDVFEHRGSGPYGEIQAPPAHPHCTCSLEYDIGEIPQ